MLDKLTQLGLSPSEAKVYLALLELGSAQAGLITKRSNINRSNCYDALQRLLEKGLVSYVITANRKQFQAEKPERFLEMLKDQEQEIKQKELLTKEILPQLLLKSKFSTKRSEATLYKGKRGVKTIFEDILKSKEYWVIGSSGKFQEVLGPFFKIFQKRVRKNKVKCKLIASENVRNTEITFHAETRYLPSEYITPISTLIYKNKVAIISWTENPSGFVLDDQQTTDSYRTYFRFMWEKAKE